MSFSDFYLYFPPWQLTTGSPPGSVTYTHDATGITVGWGWGYATGDQMTITIAQMVSPYTREDFEIVAYPATSKHLDIATEGPVLVSIRRDEEMIYPVGVKYSTDWTHSVEFWTGSAGDIVVHDGDYVEHDGDYVVHTKVAQNLLMETGDSLLLEDGEKIRMEQ